ncbi:hypothetical protein HPB52_014900 [Rhipicephalus sanguineus]|uniref:Uncharacterized protein n=1 Tax=Rhipicephalus sanguineus TaxID=34632 RepID=A0A9D4Q0D1_RHISA|nr:hypothetical protein HPB52_014900 [Rhipicephalus sanguineus]
MALVQSTLAAHGNRLGQVEHYLDHIVAPAVAAEEDGCATSAATAALNVDFDARPSSEEAAFFRARGHSTVTSPPPFAMKCCFGEKPKTFHCKVVLLDETELIQEIQNVFGSGKRAPSCVTSRRDLTVAGVTAPPFKVALQ